MRKFLCPAMGIIALLAMNCFAQESQVPSVPTNAVTVPVTSQTLASPSKATASAQEQTTRTVPIKPAQPNGVSQVNIKDSMHIIEVSSNQDGIAPQKTQVTDTAQKDVPAIPVSGNSVVDQRSQMPSCPTCNKRRNMETAEKPSNGSTERTTSPKIQHVPTSPPNTKVLTLPTNTGTTVPRRPAPMSTPPSSGGNG
jgi:hypothetical protein